MKTIAIISQKGGTGKTTLAINLAVAGELNKKSTVLIDLDPQASATGWGDLREATTPAIVSAQAARLQKILEAAKESGGDLVIIDTAPQSEKGALEAARVADLVLVPCRPALLDLNAIQHTFDLARLAKKPCTVILNQVPPRGSLSDEAESLIESQGGKICSIRLGHRAPFVHAVTAGMGVLEFEPTGKAADEIRSLYKWISRNAN